MSAPTLFDGYPRVGAVRRSDTPASRRAATAHPQHKASQASRLLLRMYHHGPVTADEAWRDLTAEGEQVTRGEWSARLGVLCAGVYPLARHAGEVADRGRNGRLRDVMSYELTLWGRAEVEKMIGGTS